MRAPDTQCGETKVVVGGNEFILCAQLRHLANAQSAAGLVGINTLLDRIRPSAATAGDYDVATIMAVFEAMTVVGDLDALRASTDPTVIGEMSVGLIQAVMAVFPPMEGDTEGNPIREG